ncbi:hypothetical protein MMC16_007436 [Acarospora aff. strigata]|nr:hypothetical protein [Acarospora aff. strigata]
MSSSNDEPGFWVVENVIEDHLINDAAKEAAQASVVKTEAQTYSRLECGPACEKLLDYYRKEKHSQTATKPEIIDIVKSPSKTEATMLLVMRIEPQNPGEKPRIIELPGDYHIIIPLVLQGLPKWVEVRSTKKRTEIPWKKGSVIYCKGETALGCSAEEQGICVFIGGKFKKE